MSRGMTVYLIDADLARCYICEGSLSKKPVHAASGKGGFCYFMAQCVGCAKELAYDCLDHCEQRERWTRLG